MPGSSSPMVGRDPERTLLRWAFDRAVKDRTCQLYDGPRDRRRGEVAARVRVPEGCRHEAAPPSAGAVSHTARASLSGRSPRSSGKRPGRVTRRRPTTRGVGRRRLWDPIRTPMSWRTASIGDPRFDRRPRITGGDVLGGTQAPRGARRATPVVVVFDDIHWGEPHAPRPHRACGRLVARRSDPAALHGSSRTARRRPGWAGGKLNASTDTARPAERLRLSRPHGEPARSNRSSPSTFDHGSRRQRRATRCSSKR